jgi:uncharacterized coiled-coil protein SlyX
VSRSGDNPTGSAGGPLLEVEQAVERALARIQELEARLAEAEGRAAELDGLLTDVTAGGERPSALLDRARALEAENEDLRDRLARGRAGVERLLARLRFIEERR